MGYGGMQALEEAYPVVADYDLVVHLHPDVLIYDCEALEARPRPWVFYPCDAFRCRCSDGPKTYPTAAL